MGEKSDEYCPFFYGASDLVPLNTSLTSNYLILSIVLKVKLKLFRHEGCTKPEALR
jgi:hypothetical protein